MRVHINDPRRQPEPLRINYPGAFLGQAHANRGNLTGSQADVSILQVLSGASQDRCTTKQHIFAVSR